MCLVNIFSAKVSLHPPLPRYPNHLGDLKISMTPSENCCLSSTKSQAISGFTGCMSMADVKWQIMDSTPTGQKIVFPLAILLKKLPFPTGLTSISPAQPRSPAWSRTFPDRGLWKAWGLISCKVNQKQFHLKAPGPWGVQIKFACLHQRL